MAASGSLIIARIFFLSVSRSCPNKLVPSPGLPPPILSDGSIKRMGPFIFLKEKVLVNLIIGYLGILDSTICLKKIQWKLIQNLTLNLQKF